VKYLFALILLVGFIITPAFAQEVKNPTLIIESIEIPAEEFNRVLRDAPIIPLEGVHGVSWQVTIDNNLLYSNPDGNAVFRLYNSILPGTDFIEIGMGPQPDNKLWIAVQTQKEGYVVIHKNLDRGWYPDAKVIMTYTDSAGLTVNNGVRIVVTNVDIGQFAIGSYSVSGKDGSTDPPAVNSGSMEIEFLSRNPSENIFSMYPFVLAVTIFIIVGVLILSKKRS